MNMEFIETIKKIQALGDIQCVAYHTFDDEVAPKILVTFEDITGNTLEINTYDIFNYTNQQLYVLISLVLSKAMDCVVMPFDIYEEINKARQKFPYTGKEWINEEKSRLYDHVAPERKF